jgi:hypothetical protein
MRIPVVLIVIAAATLGACSRPGAQKDFASPEAAVEALVKAAGSDDTSSLVNLLGKETEPLVDSGDPVQDKNGREKFLQEYKAAHSFDNSVEGETTLVIGEDKWPFPFPLIQTDGRWQFDSSAGVDEIVNRRVGKNELATIQSCLAFVDAEREYYARNPQQVPLLQFAQKLISSDGQKDGLYWPTTDAEPAAPLGEGFARARDEGYFEDGVVKGEPYHGYIYRLLKGQGSHANGGAYSYMVGDQMLGGFALLAYPAEYGTSGVMSFMVNHDGIVYSKDLGPDTAKVAESIDAFDPDDTWKAEADIKDQ